MVDIEDSDRPTQQELATRRYLLGKAVVRRVGARAFPVYELIHEGEVVARLGRFGWLSVFLGRGQRVMLSDGREWRIRSKERAGNISLVIEGTDGGLIAFGSSRPGGYGLNGKSWAYVVAPTGRRMLRRDNRWLLRGFDEVVGTVTANPNSLEATQPVPIAAALLCLDLVRYGIPGESRLNVPSFRWSNG